MATRSDVGHHLRARGVSTSVPLGGAARALVSPVEQDLQRASAVLGVCASVAGLSCMRDRLIRQSVGSLCFRQDEPR